MKLNTYVGLLTLLGLVGCGSAYTSDTNPDGTAKDPYKIQTASYKLSGGSEPICNKPGIIRKDYSDLITCSWLCGKYEGSEPSLVVISFTKEESDIWIFNDFSVSDTDFNCHN